MNQNNTNPKLEPGRKTARDLLEHLGGEQHALCSVMLKTKPFLGVFKVACTCGEVFEAGASDENKDAVRDVPELKK